MNWRNDSGQSAGPEMMLVLVFALAAWGLLAWVGRLTSSSQDMANTAQSAARAASIASDPVAGRAAAQAAVDASDLPTPCADSPSVVMAWQAGDDGNWLGGSVTVTLSCHSRQRRTIRWRRPHRHRQRHPGHRPVPGGAVSTAALRRRRWQDDRGMLGIAAALLIVMVLAGGALIYDGGRALVAQRQIINVAEGAARAGTATADRHGLQEGPAVAAAHAHIAAAGVPDSDVVSITVTPDRVTVTLRAHRAGVFTALLGNDTITVTGTGTSLSSYDP